MSNRTMVTANLAHKASELQRLTTMLCDRCEDAERYDVAGMVARAAALLADVAGTLEAREAKSHTRWSQDDDDHLATFWGPALREFKGDTEAAVAQLARDVSRTPVAVAARLVKTGVWS